MDAIAMATVMPLVSPIFLIMSNIMSVKTGDTPFSPRISGICELMTTIAVPMVKPNDIGTDTKSNMKPRLRTPNINDHIPTENDTTAAASAGGILNFPSSKTIFAVKNAVPDVGPTLISASKLVPSETKGQLCGVDLSKCP